MADGSGPVNPPITVIDSLPHVVIVPASVAPRLRLQAVNNGDGGSKQRRIDGNERLAVDAVAGTWEVAGRPYTTRAGKVVHVTIQRSSPRG